MSPSIIRVIPILRIFSIEKAKEFYLDYLGFQLDWEHRFEDSAPLYMQISRAGMVLHLTEHHGDCCPGSAVFVEMTGLDEFHQELSARNYPYLHPGICQAPYKAKEMGVIDPFGNRIRFNEYLN